MQVLAMGGISFAQGYDLRIDRARFSLEEMSGILSLSLSQSIQAMHNRRG